MTDNDSAGTAAELDELQKRLAASMSLNRGRIEPPMLCYEVRDALASLRKQLDEARGWIAAQDVDMKRLAFERDEARAANAKKDAALGMLRGIATRCEHDGNVYLAVVAEDIREALQYAALTPASQEAPASPSPEQEVLSMAQAICESADPCEDCMRDAEKAYAALVPASPRDVHIEHTLAASPSPGLLEPMTTFGMVQMREAVIEECAKVADKVAAEFQMKQSPMALTISPEAVACRFMAEHIRALSRPVSEREDGQ